MTKYIGQITVILETATSELASETMSDLAKQLDDTCPEIVFADHNGEVEDYDEIQRECEESLTTNANRPLLRVLLESLKKCAVLLADYEEHPGEEGTAYREAITAIALATRNGLPATAVAVVAPDLLAALESLAEQADEDCPAEYRTRHFIEALQTARDIIDKTKAA
jgi:hypothetical protein